MAFFSYTGEETVVNKGEIPSLPHDQGSADGHLVWQATVPESVPHVSQR